MYHVKLRGGPSRHTQWSWFTENPQGGGFGSNAGAGVPRHMTLARATKNLAPGTQYRLTVNDVEKGVFTK